MQLVAGGLLTASMWVDIAWAFGEADHGLRPGEVDAARIFAVVPMVVVGAAWLMRVLAGLGAAVESCLGSCTGRRACAAMYVCFKRSARPVWGLLMLPLLPLAPYLGASVPEFAASYSLLLPMAMATLSTGPGVFLRFRYAAAADRGAAVAGEESPPQSLVVAQVMAAVALAVGPSGLMLAHRGIAWARSWATTSAETMLAAARISAGGGGPEAEMDAAIDEASTKAVAAPGPDAVGCCGLCTGAIEPAGGQGLGQGQAERVPGAPLGGGNDNRSRAPVAGVPDKPGLTDREHKVLVMRSKSIRDIRRGGPDAGVEPEDDVGWDDDDANQLGEVGGRPLSIAEALVGRGHVDDLGGDASVKAAAALGLGGRRPQLLFGSRLLQPVEGQVCVPCLWCGAIALLVMGSIVPLAVVGMLWRGGSPADAIDAAASAELSLPLDQVSVPGTGRGGGYQEDGEGDYDLTGTTGESALLWVHFAGQISDWRVAVLMALVIASAVLAVVPHCLFGDFLGWRFWWGLTIALGPSPCDKACGSVCSCCRCGPKALEDQGQGRAEEDDEEARLVLEADSAQGIEDDCCGLGAYCCCCACFGGMWSQSLLAWMPLLLVLVGASLVAPQLALLYVLLGVGDLDPYYHTFSDPRKHWRTRAQVTLAELLDHHLPATILPMLAVGGLQALVLAMLLVVPGGSSLPGVGQGWADGPLAAPVTLASGLALDLGGLALLLGAWSRMSSLYPLASSRTQAVDDGHPADIVGLTAEDQEALKGAGDDASRRKRARRHRLSFLRGGRGRRAKRASQLLLAMQQRELLRQLQEEGDLDEEKGLRGGGRRTRGDVRYDASEDEDEDGGEQDNDSAGVVVARRPFGGGGEVSYYAYGAEAV